MRRPCSLALCSGATVGVFVAAGPASAIVIGTLDTFQDLTTQDWEGASPVNIPDGGPGGAGDAFLSITSTGGGGIGSRLATDNGSDRWIGDYIAAGVTAMEADFLNMGMVELEMRVVLFHGPGNRYTSTVSGLVPADGAWHHLIFPIDEGSLTQVLGGVPYAEGLAGVDNLMFRHNSGDPTPGGTPIATSLGIDNIRAVPAPGAATLLGLCVLGARRRRR